MMKEWEVSCDWCGAKVGEPCVNNINGTTTEVYDKEIHIPRARLYDEKHGLNYLDREPKGKLSVVPKDKKEVEK